MGNIKEEVFLGAHETYNEKLAELAAMTQPEIWSFGKEKEKDPYRILRNYFQFTYNRLAEENKIMTSSDGIFRCMNTGLLTVYNQEIIAVFSKNVRQGGLPFYYHNSETGENKIQLLVPLYFPGAPVRLALVLNKVTSPVSEYYEGVTILPVEWAYMNARLIARPDEEWARIIVEADTAEDNAVFENNA